MGDDEHRFPVWIGGVLLALVLIVIGARGGIGNPELSRRFAPPAGAPTPAPFQPPQLHIPDLPPDIQRAVTQLRERFVGGERVPALTPVATGPRMRVEIQAVQRSGDQVHVTGSVANISDLALTIPAGTFSFRDSDGISYATSGGSTTLQPGQSTSLDLSVPLPPDRGLTLIADLPPDPPVEQLLVVAAPS